MSGICISIIYLFIILLYVGSTIIGPSFIYLMMVGAFVTSFELNNWISFWCNSIPIVIFALISFFGDVHKQVIINITNLKLIIINRINLQVFINVITAYSSRNYLRLIWCSNDGCINWHSITNSSRWTACTQCSFISYCNRSVRSNRLFASSGTIMFTLRNHLLYYCAIYVHVTHYFLYLQST